MLKKRLKTFVLVLPLAICGCQSVQKVPQECPAVPALNIQKEEPTLTGELLRLLSPSQNGETTPSGG